MDMHTCHPETLAALAVYFGGVFFLESPLALDPASPFLPKGRKRRVKQRPTATRGPVQCAYSAIYASAPAGSAAQHARTPCSQHGPRGRSTRAATSSLALQHAGIATIATDTAAHATRERWRSATDTEAQQEGPPWSSAAQRHLQLTILIAT